MASKVIESPRFADAGEGYIQSINAGNFDAIALELFTYQYSNNGLYRQFAERLGKSPDTVKSIADIPYLPVSFFKTHRIRTGNDGGAPELFFETSTTTGDAPGLHEIFSAQLYNSALMAGFRAFYGTPSQYAILALLPSYLERKTSSLVHMAKLLMEESGHADNGFYLHEWDKLSATITRLENEQQPTLLLGVTFALLDFAEHSPLQLQHTIVMETGGMKGRREEWTRAQVHHFLAERWAIKTVHAEYGMTEMLSQAYSNGEGFFRPSSTMKVLVREMNDPLAVSGEGTGCINIIDLANVHSCAFLATDDIGRMSADGPFEILGRADYSALRGCSLMTA